jgi:hypothetical protein
MFYGEIRVFFLNLYKVYLICICMRCLSILTRIELVVMEMQRYETTHRFRIRVGRKNHKNVRYCGMNSTRLLPMKTQYQARSSSSAAHV